MIYLLLSKGEAKTLRKFLKRAKPNNALDALDKAIILYKLEKGFNWDADVRFNMSK